MIKYCVGGKDFITAQRHFIAVFSPSELFTVVSWGMTSKKSPFTMTDKL